MVIRIRSLREKNYLAEIANKKAVIDSLQKQIKPHYIYNTIETFKMMAEIDGQKELSDALTSFGSQIRYTMVYGSRPTTLAKELENLRDYIRIQNLINNNLLELHINVEGVAMYSTMPMLVLQPLAENAILHGYDHKNKLSIHIDREILEDCIIISVTNNGKLISSDRLKEIRKELEHEIIESTRNNGDHEGIALVNIHNRIRLMYGEKYGLSIDNNPDGVTVKVRLPRTSEDIVEK